MDTWIVVVGWISKSVLGILLLLSMWSVAIMIDRFKLFRLLEQRDPPEEALRLIRERNWKALEAWARDKGGLRSGALLAAIELGVTDGDKVDRAVRSFVAREKSQLESGMTTLATLGSNAPFIGLFGTVLGIIQAFGVLADSQYSSTMVMSGISEALVATAIGLFVAIPALIAYNAFSRRLKLILTDCDVLRDSYISRLSEQKE